MDAARREDEKNNTSLGFKETGSLESECSAREHPDRSYFAAEITARMSSSSILVPWAFP